MLMATKIPSPVNVGKTRIGKNGNSTTYVLHIMHRRFQGETLAPDKEHDSTLAVQYAAAALMHSWTTQLHPTPVSHTKADNIIINACPSNLYELISRTH